MANANTDQVVRAAEIAPIAAPTAATLTVFQRSAASAQGRGAGNANVEIPGQYKVLPGKVRVRVYGNSKLATTASQSVNVAIQAVNAAGTAVTIASSGAIAAATQAGNTVGWYVECEVLLDANSAAVLAGEFSANYGGTLTARTALAAQPGFTFNTPSGTSATQGLAENQYFQVAVTQNIADATAVHTVNQLSTEIL